MDQTQPQLNSDNAWRAPAPAQMTTLEDGLPLYYALLNDSDDGVLDQREVRAAKADLSEAIKIDDERVRELAGATHEQARQVLREILGQNVN